MKKILFGILTFLGIGLSFCSADIYSFTATSNSCSPDPLLFNAGDILESYSSSSEDFCSTTFDGTFNIHSSDGDFSCSHVVFSHSRTECDYSSYPSYPYTITSDSSLSFSSLSCNNSLTQDVGTFTITSSTPSVPEITVYYNSGSSTNITCDGVQAIQINGLSTITSTNTFTPYFNISYIDEDNQSLTESYSKNILYLENGQFKKTYTGNNDWILTYQGSSDSTFTGYVPVFDFTGDTIVNTGNVFNNFSDNALKVLLSNIPSYIQYITIFAILVFLFSFIRRFKRKS